MRSYLTLPYTVGSTLVFAWPVMAVAPFSPETAFSIARTWSRGILRSGNVKVYADGLDKLPAGPVVVMSNHQSLLDVPVLFDILPYDIHFVAKKELRYVPVFGWGVKSMGHIFVDRGNHAAAVASLDEAATEIREGKSIAVFPEGTRSKDGSLLPFKKGGFVLAIKAGVPILPVTIAGSHDVLPVGANRIVPGAVQVHIHDPIETTGLSLDDKDRLIEETRAAIAAGLVR